jgi:hypothetical protein
VVRRLVAGALLSAVAVLLVAGMVVDGVAAFATTTHGSRATRPQGASAA